MYSLKYISEAKINYDISITIPSIFNMYCVSKRKNKTFSQLEQPVGRHVFNTVIDTISFHSFTFHFLNECLYVQFFWGSDVPVKTESHGIYEFAHKFGLNWGFFFWKIALQNSNLYTLNVRNDCNLWGGVDIVFRITYAMGRARQETEI